MRTPLETKLIQKHIDLGKCQINYLQSGESTATPILFLHGWAIGTGPYQELLQLLAQRHPVIAPDLPGLAASHCTHSVSDYGTYAEYLIAFIKALHLKKVHLIGHSLGGGISVTIAAHAPKLVQSLILIDSTGIPIGSVPEVLLRRAIEMPLQVNLPKLKLQFIDIPQVFLANLLTVPQNVIFGLLTALEKDLRPLLSQIKAPALLIWSEKDLTIPFSIAEEFLQRIEKAKLVKVSEGFHEWALLYPEKFATIVAQFLAQFTPTLVRDRS